MKSYRPYAPGQAFLLPPSPNERLPEDHVAYFVLDLFADMDLGLIERSLQGKDARASLPHHVRQHDHDQIELGAVVQRST